MQQVFVWTDGSVYKNPGPGGWASILFSDGIAKVIGGIAKNTTNNRMEAWAVYEALKALKHDCAVDISTDSQYVIYGILRILQGKPLLGTNTDVWEKIRDLAKMHRIRYEKVPGHENDKLNNAADTIARLCSQQRLSVNAYIDDPAVLLGEKDAIHNLIVSLAKR